MTAPLSRRAALASIASMGALIVPTVALAAPVDPIFAAIEQHKAAQDAFSNSLDAQDSVYARNHGREVTQADVDASEAALDFEGRMREAMFQTPIATMAGLRAMLEYAAKVEDVSEDELGDFLANLLTSPVLNS
jgi:hypothetical protein